MTNEIEARNASTLAVSSNQAFWTEQQVAALRQIGVENASNGDLAVFLNYAQRTGLDPFARQIYMIGRRTKQGDNWTTKWTIQASIDGLRIVAERSGDYAGQTAPEFCGEDGVWRDVWTSNQPPVAARVGVYRRGFTEALYGVAYYDEYVQTAKDGKPTSMWTKPRIMLAKCAEAVALRKAFPQDLSGIYTADEMSQTESHPAPMPAQHAAPAVPFDAETGEVLEGSIVEDSDTYEDLEAAFNEAKDLPALNAVGHRAAAATLPNEQKSELRALYLRRATEVGRAGASE
jgi:phage recombination protein Bet